jgi:hypothetical protein
LPELNFGVRTLTSLLSDHDLETRIRLVRPLDVFGTVVGVERGTEVAGREGDAAERA